MTAEHAEHAENLKAMVLYATEVRPLLLAYRKNGGKKKVSEVQ